MTVYTVAQVAKRWGVSTRTVYSLLRQNKLIGFRVGGSWRVSEDAVKHYEGADRLALDNTPRFADFHKII